MNRALGILIALLVLVGLAFGFVMVHRVIAPPAALTISSSRLSTTWVRPGGYLAMNTVEEVHVSPECQSGAQRIIHYSDGSVARLPGTRRATMGTRQTVTHEVTIPFSAPLGRASMQIRETFTCTALEPVESEILEFEIVDGEHGSRERRKS